MVDAADDWRAAVRAQLTAALDLLDRHGEHMIAAHVGMALSYVEGHRPDEVDDPA